MLVASIFEEIQKIDIFDLRSKKSKCSQSHSNYMCTNENVIALLPVKTVLYLLRSEFGPLTSVGEVSGPSTYIY